MSIEKRLTEWLAELDASADRPDKGDGWQITDLGRAARERDRQRAEDLRTLIDAKTL
jgi:hypothetical protein